LLLGWRGRLPGSYLRTQDLLHCLPFDGGASEGRCVVGKSGAGVRRFVPRNNETGKAMDQQDDETGLYYPYGSADPEIDGFSVPSRLNALQSDRIRSAELSHDHDEHRTAGTVTKTRRRRHRRSFEGNINGPLDLFETESLTNRQAKRSDDIARFACHRRAVQHDHLSETGQERQRQIPEKHLSAIDGNTDQPG